jgi:hypothetical protein
MGPMPGPGRFSSPPRKAQGERPAAGTPASRRRPRSGRDPGEREHGRMVREHPAPSPFPRSRAVWAGCSGELVQSCPISYSGAAADKIARDDFTQQFHDKMCVVGQQRGLTRRRLDQERPNSRGTRGELASEVRASTPTRCSEKGPVSPAGETTENTGIGTMYVRSPADVSPIP